MEAFKKKKYRLYIKLGSFYKFTALTFSIIYGFFIVFLLNLQYQLGSGDIASYLHFFNQFDGRDAPELTVQQDGAFRLSVFFLRDFFGVEALTILGVFGFLTATIMSYIFLTHIRSEKDLVYLLPLLIMMFISPVTQVLFSSNIRSGIAFTLLMIGIIYLRGLPRLASFAVSSIIHLSMIPFVGLFILYHLKNRLNYDGMKINNTFTFILLLSASIFLSVVGGIFYGGTAVSSSFAYNLLILYVAFLMIFTGRKLITNVFGFMSAGMIFIYFTGIFIDVSYSRYIGNALLLYFLFLIQQGEERKIEVFTVGFIPFFILTSSYMFSNLS
mgnify:FL=1|tara:strand:+ start:3658 stop:4641 length:984 start_codon:yes stop_codon:yes gene_type:complete